MAESQRHPTLTLPPITPPSPPAYPINLWVTEQYRGYPGEQHRALRAIGPGGRRLLARLEAIVQKWGTVDQCTQAALAEIRALFEETS